MADGPSDADLDEILKSALDDFEDDEINDTRADKVAAEKNKEQMTENMASLMDDLQNPEFQQTLEQTFKVLSHGSGDVPSLETFMETMQSSAAAMPIRTGEDTTDAALVAKVGKTDMEKEKELEEELIALQQANGDKDEKAAAIAAAVEGTTKKSKKPIPHTITDLPKEAGDLWQGSLPVGANSGDTGDKEELDKSVAKTLQGLADASKEMEGMQSGQAEMVGEEMMKEMMKEFEKMGEKEDFGNVMDGMMRQLLAREVLYEPMKQVCEKYPEWLAENEKVLSQEDYTRYGHQYQYFQKIVAVYDTEPDNFPRLMELMQDMQECGQPPSEIIKELAPGLEFGPDGMPVMPNMGPGMMPGMPNLSAGPNGMPTGPDGQPCTIM